MTPRALLISLLLTACGSSPDGDSTDGTVDTTDTEPVDTTDTEPVDSDSDSMVDTEVETDPCDPNPCDNAGTCEAVDEAAVCTCVDGTSGDFCEFAGRYFPPITETTQGNNQQLIGTYTRMLVYQNDPDQAPTEPFLVNSVSFRRDSSLNGGSTTLEDVVVYIGVGAGFDEVFDANFVSEKREIFNDTLTIGPRTGEPLDFTAWTIDIDPPFLVDPAVGRVQFDIQVPEPGNSLPLDCNNDGKVYMFMTHEAPDDTTGEPPATRGNLTGCGYAMRLGIAPAP